MPFLLKYWRIVAIVGAVGAFAFAYWFLYNDNKKLTRELAEERVASALCDANNVLLITTIEGFEKELQELQDSNKELEKEVEQSAGKIDNIEDEKQALLDRLNLVSPPESCQDIMLWLKTNIREVMDTYEQD